MTRLCIEDGFFYNLERAVSDFFDGYDTPDEALKEFNEGDHDDFVNALLERAQSYTDLQEIAISERDKRNAR